MPADFLAWIWPALPWLFAAGCLFVIAGAAALVAFRRQDVTLGPVPAKLTAPPTAVLRATPVCPICGGPWRAVCPSKERVEEVRESALTRIAPYAPQWPDQTLPLRLVDGPTLAELDALAAKHRAPEPECPLTTDTIRIDIHAPTPIHDAAVRGDTVDLSAKTQRIKAVAS